MAVTLYMTVYLSPICPFSRLGLDWQRAHCCGHGGSQGSSTASSCAGAGYSLLQQVVTGLVGTPTLVCCGASLGASVCALCAM